MTPEQIQKLKDNWSQDPCWDIEDTEGFEAHKEELLAFRRQKEAEWEIRRIARLESQAKELGVDLRTAERVSDLQAQADTEIRHAKNLLSHYMHMALPCLNLDNHSEIISICDHIVNAAKCETMRQFEIDRAIER